MSAAGGQAQRFTSHPSPRTVCPALPGPPPPCRLRTGTSQAVPLVAGVMALLLQDAPSTPPADMQRLLVSAAAKGKLLEVPGSGKASFGEVRGS